MLPNIAPVASMLAELEIVQMRIVTRLPHEDQLVLAAIKAPHPCIGLGPNAQVP
jgi:hypothetical protein